MKKKPKIKEKSITKLRKKAWKLQSMYIRQKEKGKCFTCGDQRDWKEQQAGHFVHRDSVDFDLRNIHCQCVHCNKWLHGNLINYAIKLERIYGHGIIEELKRKGDQIKKWKVKELEDLIEFYKNEL